MNITLKLSSDLVKIDLGQHEDRIKTKLKEMISELESDFRDSNINFDIDFIQLTQGNYIYTKEIKTEFTAIAKEEKGTIGLIRCVDCANYSSNSDTCIDNREQGIQREHSMTFKCEGFKNRNVND